MMILLLFVIGVILGSIGGGGGLLIFPTLLFINQRSPEDAALLSMTIVGIAAISSLISQKINPLLFLSRELLPFIIGSILFIFVSKWGLVQITIEWVKSFGSAASLHQLLMFLFVPIIAYSGWNTWPGSKKIELANKWNTSSGFLYGSLTGTLAGLFGAGGGFIIVPVLNQVAQFPIYKAIQTSLIIIGINGVFGGVVPSFINGKIGITEGYFIISTATGAMLGGYWAKRIRTDHLKKGLSIFLITVALFIFAKELYQIQ
jgi:uncharacterized membrane protein YfcA